MRNMTGYTGVTNDLERTRFLIEIEEFLWRWNGFRRFRGIGVNFDSHFIGNEEQTRETRV